MQINGILSTVNKRVRDITIGLDFGHANAAMLVTTSSMIMCVIKPKIPERMWHLDNTCVWVLLNRLIDQRIDVSTIERNILHCITVSLQKLAIGFVAGVEWRLKLERDLIELDDMGDGVTLARFKTSVENFFEAKTQTIPLGRLFRIPNPKGQMSEIVQRALFMALALVSVADA